MIADTDLYATYYSNNGIDGDEIESYIDYFVITKTMPVFLCFSLLVFSKGLLRNIVSATILLSVRLAILLV
jgi:hypothetical protein